MFAIQPWCIAHANQSIFHTRRTKLAPIAFSIRTVLICSVGNIPFNFESTVMFACDALL